MSFYNHITTVEIAERGALSAMPIGTAGLSCAQFIYTSLFGFQHCLDIIDAFSLARTMEDFSPL